MNVSVSGLGKAGLPLAAVIADSGIKVIGIDISSKTVELINSGNAPFEGEPMLPELIKKHAGGNLIATTDAADAVRKTEAHIVIVPLFIDSGKRCDFKNIDRAMADIGSNMKKGDLVVLETTVPPGTTEGRVRKMLEERSGLRAGKDFHLAYSPERIMTGFSISRIREFPKIVGGVDEASADHAYSLYSSFCRISKVSNARTAEMVKISEGIYRDVNIGLANELLKVCEKNMVDFWEMREAANHSFCNIHLPGNVGGHCIPVYPWMLINDNDVPLIRTAREENDGMIMFYADKVGEISPSGKVGIIGLTYREGVKEMAYARSLPFAQELMKRGYEVFCMDPSMTDMEIAGLGLKPFSDAAKMDVIVLFNNLPSYKDALKGLKVVDIHNALR